MPKYLEKPLVFFDIETTGLRPGYHEITELSFIHETHGSWCERVKPRYMDRFEDVARKISRYSETDWADALNLEDIISKVHEFTYEAIIVGHNILGFDLPFANGNFKMLGLDFRFETKMNAVIDTQMLALALLVPQGLKRLSLNACCDFFNISNDGAHNAYDDCLRTKMFFEKLMEEIRFGDAPIQKIFW